MKKLIACLEELRLKLGRLRKEDLKETPTRTIFVDMVLDALGWDVRDPDEVELEYPTIDGKSVDYALKINRKAVLVVEAKPLNDSLDDVKAITQIVSYAANDGIEWCVLTNGVKWRVYRSVEKCPAPDKLLYEVSYDPQDAEQMTLDQIAEQLWRFSRDEMGKETLDAIGEQVFTDGKVRKALDRIMLNPPRSVINAIRSKMKDSAVKPKQIQVSLTRIWSASSEQEAAPPPATEQQAESEEPTPGEPKREKREYEEAIHTEGKPSEVAELYRTLKQLCLGLEPGSTSMTVQKKYVAFRVGKRIFCSVHTQQSGLRVWLKLKYGELGDPPAFARDVTNVGHWGTGDLELAISNRSDLTEAEALIQQSFDASK